MYFRRKRKSVPHKKKKVSCTKRIERATNRELLRERTQPVERVVHREKKRKKRKERAKYCRL